MQSGVGSMRESRALWSILFAAAVGCGPGKPAVDSGAGPETATPAGIGEPAEHDDGHEAAVHDEHAGHAHDVPAEPTSTPPVPSADPAAAALAAYERAKPVFEQRCARCHKTGGPGAKKASLEHFSMDSYPFGGHHAGEIAAAIRKVLGAGGGKATMPADKPGVVQGEELALVLAWADAAERAASDARPHGHDER